VRGNVNSGIEERAKCRGAPNVEIRVRADARPTFGRLEGA
jgi:hypothetical protein